MVTLADVSCTYCVYIVRAPQNDERPAKSSDVDKTLTRLELMNNLTRKLVLDGASCTWESLIQLHILTEPCTGYTTTHRLCSPIRLANIARIPWCHRPSLLLPPASTAAARINIPAVAGKVIVHLDPLAGPASRPSSVSIGSR